jgi:hypothetical protein
MLYWFRRKSSRRNWPRFLKFPITIFYEHSLAYNDLVILGANIPEEKAPKLMSVSNLRTLTRISADHPAASLFLHAFNGFLNSLARTLTRHPDSRFSTAPRDAHDARNNVNRWRHIQTFGFVTRLLGMLPPHWHGMQFFFFASEPPDPAFTIYII